MKKLILSLAIITGLSATAFAQAQKGDCCKSKAKICKMDSTICNKDSDKRCCKNAKKINKKHSKKHDIQRRSEQRHGEGIFKDLNLTDAQKEKLKDLRKEHQAKTMEQRKSQMEEMRAVLTPEQIAKLDSLKKVQSRKDRPVGTVKFDEATEAKIKTLNNELKEKREAIKKTKVAPEVKKKKLNELNEEYSKKRSEIVEQSLSK